MSVRANSDYERREEEGETELVLAAVTYTGDRSIFGMENMRTEGGYPALDQFRGPGPDEEEGETKLTYLPSDRLGWWENHAHFEVAYDDTSMARTLLTQNYIPEQIVGPGYDAGVREDLMEKLGLDPFTGEEGLREQLREVAGMTEDEDDRSDVEEPDLREEELKSTNRSVLIKVANSYEEVDNLLDELDKSSVSHLTQTELSEFLAERDSDEVDRRISTAEQGGEL